MKLFTRIISILILCLANGRKSTLLHMLQLANNITPRVSLQLQLSFSWHLLKTECERKIVGRNIFGELEENLLPI